MARIKPMDLAELRVGPWRGRMLSEWVGCGLDRLFEDDQFPSRGFAGEVQAVASNIGGTYLITLQGGSRFFAKCFSARGPKDLLASWLGPAGAGRSWKAARLAAELGLPAPRPVALFERRFLGALRYSVFISEAVPHAAGQNLEEYFRGRFGPAGRDRERTLEKRELIRALGRLFQEAHGQDRIYFPDFHPHNLVLQKPPDGGLRLYLVDFDEVRFKGRRQDRMKNLASLCRNADKINRRMERKAISGGDRLRFLRAYLGEEAGWEEVKGLAAEIRKNWNLK